MATLAILTSKAQQINWSESDRHYLIDNMIRSRNELIKETEYLSDAQWNFKESPDRWSIKEIVEHIAIWELLLQREVSMALFAGPHPDWSNNNSDSVILGFIMEQNPHIATEYTVPFTFTVPMGLNSGESNVKWFLKMRNESIDFLNKTSQNLRNYYLKQGRNNLHQVYITTFGHTDRHLRQIRKVKQHPNYPK